MKNENENILLILITVLLIIQATVFVFGDSSHFAGSGRDEKLLALQGKDYEETVEGRQVKRNEPRDLSALPLVAGVKPGEGKAFPHSPRTCLPAYPLMKAATPAMDVMLTHENNQEKYRLLIYWTIMLENQGKLVFDKSQAERLQKIFQMREEIHNARESARMTILSTLTPGQLEYLGKNKRHETYDDKSDGAILDLLKNYSISARSGTADQSSGNGHKTYFSRWDYHELISAIPSIISDSPHSLTKGQCRVISSALEEAVNKGALVDKSNEMLKDFLSKPQKDYVELCLSDPAFMELIDSSYSSGPEAEPILGVDYAMYLDFETTLKRRAEGKTDGNSPDPSH